MNHNISIDGYCYRLRPVTIKDAPFIVDIRTEDAERCKYINPVSKDISLQIKWLENYFNTPNDYYFIIENKNNNLQEGLISIYNINDNKGESGRWIIKKDSLAAVESYYLLCRIAFEILQLNEVFSNVVIDNKPVVAFHKSIKQKVRRTITKMYQINNIEYDAIEFFIDKKHFFNIVKPRLEQITKKVFGK